MLSMKKNRIILFSLMCVLGISSILYYLYFFRIYNSDDPRTIEVAAVFSRLVDAWNQDDTNTVRILCAASFDPYSKENYTDMNFQMTRQSTIGHISLESCPDGSFAFYPSARRSITTIFRTPYYFLGKVYFYEKDENQWKFTGRTDYYVD